MYIWSIGVFDVDRPSLSNLTTAKLIFVNGLYIDRLMDKSFVTVIHLQALFVQDSYSARRQAINMITFDMCPCSVLVIILHCISKLFHDFYLPNSNILLFSK